MTPRPIDCEEALRRLALYLDRELDPARHREVQRHLETCRSCFSRAEFERGLKERLSELRSREVDPAFQTRIVEVIRRFRPAPEAGG